MDKAEGLRHLLPLQADGFPGEQNLLRNKWRWWLPMRSHRIPGHSSVLGWTRPPQSHFCVLPVTNDRGKNIVLNSWLWGETEVGERNCPQPWWWLYYILICRSALVPLCDFGHLSSLNPRLLPVNLCRSEVSSSESTSQGKFWTGLTKLKKASGQSCLIEI